MKVIFDSNVFRKVIAPPDSWRGDDAAAYANVRAAIEDHRVIPLVSVTQFWLEEIPRVDRPAYLAGYEPKIEFEECEENGTLKLSIRIKQNPDMHRGLSSYSRDRLESAIGLGFKLVHAPRIGASYPPEVSNAAHPERFLVADDLEKTLQRTFHAARAVEERGLGYAAVKALLARIQRRSATNHPPRTSIMDDSLFNPSERQELAAAVAEWADGDTVAACIGYGCHVLCTQDIAGRSRPSVFNPTNREWLTKEYGIDFKSIDELSSLLSG